VQTICIVAQRSDVVLRYIQDTGLPFDILVDEERRVSKLYGVWHGMGWSAWNIARPALFLIDRTNVVRYAFVASRQDEFPSHEEIVAELDKL
jgi:peroxiredoxin Q/BCP